MPAGKRFFSSAILALMVSATSSALEPGNWKMARPTDGWPSRRQIWSYCCAPSSIRATSLRRTTCVEDRVCAEVEPPWLVLMMMSPNSSGLIEPAERAHRELELLTGWHRLLADLAGGDLHVLILAPR